MDAELLRGLVKKWRLEAVKHPHSAYHAYHNCADELEAALSVAQGQGFVMVPADELLDAYDRAMMELAADEEAGWNEGNCRATYARRIRRIRAIILRRAAAPAQPDGVQS